MKLLEQWPDGGYLAAINDFQENNFVKDYLGTNNIYNSAFIGFRNGSWADGSSLGYNNFHPDIKSNQNYYFENYPYSEMWSPGVEEIRQPWQTEIKPGIWNTALNNQDGRQQKGVAEIPLSYFSIADASFREGKGGDITITRTGGTTTSQTLRVKSSDGTATTSDNDYTAINTTVTFAAGETSKTISVSTTEDLDVEDDETFNLTITAEGTDDVPPQISDGSATVTLKADDFKRGNSLYTIVDGPSWIESERAAQKLGGNLVAIESAAENEYIAQKFLDNAWGRHNNKWIGLSDQESEGNFKWSNKSTSSYRNWARSEPNGGKSENYVQIRNFDSRGKGVWNDAPNNPSPERYIYATEGIAEISLAPKPTYSLSTSTTSIDEESEILSSYNNIDHFKLTQDTRLYYTICLVGINLALESMTRFLQW